MGLDFRRFAAEIPADDTEPAEQPDENDVQEDAPEQEGTPAVPQADQPPSCSYCGGTYFEPTEHNGRTMRAECEECGGTQVSHDGIGWNPDLIGSPHNHPRGDADPASGGVSGVGNIPQRTTEQQLRTAGANGELPEGLSLHARAYQPGEDEHADLDSHFPGWTHGQVSARVLGRSDPVGHIEFSAGPDSVQIHETRVHSKYQRRGIGTAMNTHLQGLFPEHTVDRGSATKDGDAFRESLENRMAALDDPELRLHMTAAWADVRAKAMRIRAAGGVLIKVASADGVGGEVRGDHGTYETVLTYLPGSRKVSSWRCECAWGTYAFDRSPAYQRFAGRLCSHGLAMQLEAQSHDRPVTESHPGWMRHRRTRHVVESAVAEEVYPDGHGLDLVHPPVYGFVLDALARGADPAQGMSIMLTAGIEHARAKALLREALTKSPAKDDTPTHAGLVLKAGDTGRVLMLQRSMEDEKDPAAGRWEWPGGGMEDGDHNSLHGAFREFAEEVGHPVPKGGTLQHVWHSGPYVGHVMVVPSEADLPLHQERTVDNPDGDHHEQSAWWDPQHARKNPALREECKTSPWDEIQGADRGKTATYSVNDSMGSPLEDPPALSTPPQQVQSENPASTGFATGADPAAFNDATQRSMSIPDMASYAQMRYSSSAETAPEAPMGRYFHNSNSKFNPGDVLRPKAETGRTTLHKWEHDLYSPHHVYVWHENALRDGSVHDFSGFGRHTYEVEPLGHTEHDPEKYQEDSAEFEHSFRTPAARVTKVLCGQNNVGDGYDVHHRACTAPQHRTATLHDEPEGALPSTDGADDDTLFDDPGAMVRSEMSGEIPGTESVNPTTLHGAALTPSAPVGDIVAQFQATAGAKTLGTAAGPSDGDIASAARDHLTKAAVKTFSPFEQQELITEGVREKVRARNSDRLSLEGTHYIALEEALARQGDPDDCLII